MKISNKLPTISVLNPKSDFFEFVENPTLAPAAFVLSARTPSLTRCAILCGILVDNISQESAKPYV